MVEYISLLCITMLMKICHSILKNSDDLEISQI